MHTASLKDILSTLNNVKYSYKKIIRKKLLSTRKCLHENLIPEDEEKNEVKNGGI